MSDITERLRAVSEWQTMETAPRDGTRFIALARDGRIITMFYKEYVETWKQNQFKAWVPDRLRGDFVEAAPPSGVIAPRAADWWQPMIPPPSQEVDRQLREGRMLSLGQLSGGPR